MLKRTLGKSHCEGEPQAKRPNFAFFNNSDSSQNENIVTILPSKVQNPKKYPLPTELLEKKPIDKSHFFDNLLDYFDGKTGEDLGGSNKRNIAIVKPVIRDSDTVDPPCPKSKAGPNEVPIPQMLVNPKAYLNTCTPTKKNQPDNPMCDQKLVLRCQSGPEKQTKQNPVSSDKKSSSSREKTSKADNYPLIVFSQGQQLKCCVIDSLIKRFRVLPVVKPLPAYDICFLIANGRPTPALPNLGVSVNLYDHHLWIAGCTAIGRLYCWECLLFSSKLTKANSTVWVREGFRAMHTLGTSMTKHTNSLAHREAVANKHMMIQNGEIPNENESHSSFLMKAGFSVEATKPTANNQLVDQNKEKSSLSPVPPRTNILFTVDVKNEASSSLSVTEPLPFTINESTNDQNLYHKDIDVKPSCLQLRELPSIDYNIQTLKLDSTTDDVSELKECNPAVPSADKNRENLRASQPKIRNLMNSGNHERLSPKTEELFGSNDSSNEDLAQHVSPARYLKLREEIETKEKILWPSANNKRQPAVSPSPTHATDADLPSSRRIVDLAIIRARFFKNGIFNRSEKLRELIITTGRPTPEMPGLAQEVKGVMKRFSTFYYEEFPWMCGSAEMNKVFCWPCVMYNDHERHNNFWNTVGYNDLVNLSPLAKNHSISQTHLELSIRLKMAESKAKNKNRKTKIDSTKHNETVRQKRGLMKYLIDAVCFKKKLLNNVEICHDDFNDVLKILSNYDIKLKALLDPESSSYVTDFIPNFITNYSHEITKALKTILQRKISEEVEDSVYVSFILKAVKNNRIALILRYIKSTGEVYERFYKFFKIGFGLPEDLLKAIVEAVHGLKCSTKFVGMTYDGGVLRPDQMEFFNAQLRVEHKAAYVFPYRYDSFQTLLQQSLSRAPFCRSFFQLVAELGEFLQANPRVRDFVGRLECEKSLENPEDWDLKSGIIITICEHYLGIVKLFDQIVNEPSSPHFWTNRVKLQCSKFSLLLRLVETRMFLVFFSKVHVALHPAIEAFNGEFDANHWKLAISKSCNAIQIVRNGGFQELSYVAESLLGRTVFGLEHLSESDETRLSKMFNDAADWILSFLKCSTINIYIWSYFDFSTKKIESPVVRAYRGQARLLTDLKEFFPFFDSPKLCSVLIFAHSHSQFRDKSAAEIIQVMEEFDFKSVLPELYSFLLLIQTVPLSPDNVSKPASDKIATYVEGKTHLKSVDALLHLESDLLSLVRSKDGFYSDVLKIISKLKPTNEFTEIDQSGKFVENN